MVGIKIPRLGLDVGNSPGEFSVLGVVGIGDDLHRRDHIKWQAEGGTPSGGIGDIRTVHERATLGIPRTLQVYQSIGPTNDSRHEWKRTFKGLVDIGSVLYDFLVDGFGRSRTIGVWTACRYCYRGLDFG